MIKVAILGSTGSIGRQTLDVIGSYDNLFRVEVLTAADNWELLAQQARQFKPDVAVIANEAHYKKLREALRGTPTLARCGVDAIEEVTTHSAVDVVVISIVGFAGLAPTIAAIKARKRVALANKESLVVGGQIVMPLADAMGIEIMPIDSEHSAIFQCLVGELSPLRRILLTASGGSVRDVPIEKLDQVTAAQVLKHPVWDMGSRITVDSATMLNKGFEVIEAAHLFRVTGDQIDVVIHRQSIIHSAVEFVDGAIKAQLSCPDMRLPIQYALTYPERMEMECIERFDPFKHGTLTFEKPDIERYPCLQLAFNALEEGGILPSVLNAAGEVAVEAFLKGKISFPSIARVIDRTMNAIDNEPLSVVGQLYEADATARVIASEHLSKL